MVGYCSVLVKPSGPVQAKVQPGTGGAAVMFRALPEHTGELLPITGSCEGVTDNVMVDAIVHTPNAAVTV